MYIIGVAVLIKTEDNYKGIAKNVSNGQIFVGLDNPSSREHYLLQRIIYKIHGTFPDQMVNATLGYLAIDDLGNVYFVNRKEASKANNLKCKEDVIYSYDVKWDNEISVLYEQERENMRNIMKEHDLTDEDFFG